MKAAPKPQYPVVKPANLVQYDGILMGESVFRRRPFCGMYALTVGPSFAFVFRLWHPLRRSAGRRLCVL